MMNLHIVIQNCAYVHTANIANNKDILADVKTKQLFDDVG